MNRKRQKRALSVNSILAKRYKTFAFSGPWYEAFGRPETTGVWFVWGNSGNGKTSFVMQLCKELCKYNKVLFDSLEEGTSLTMRNNLERYGLEEVNRRLFLVTEDMDALKKRLINDPTMKIIIIDSFQYTGMTYRDYIGLKEAFRGRLFIFISHARGKNPKGNAAENVLYDATLKIWVEGYKAISNGRFIGPTGEYTIWADGAKKYWGKEREDNDKEENHEDEE